MRGSEKKESMLRWAKSASGVIVLFPLSEVNCFPCACFVFGVFFVVVVVSGQGYRIEWMVGKGIVKIELFHSVISNSYG